LTDIDTYKNIAISELYQDKKQVSIDEKNVDVV